MKKSLLASGLLVILMMSGCGASATIANIGIPANVREVTSGTIGKTPNLKYLTDLSVDEACAAQTKIMTEAKWTERESMKKMDNYSKATYSDGKSDMVVLCSQTEVSATQKATKVTLTWMQNP